MSTWEERMAARARASGRAGSGQPPGSPKPFGPHNLVDGEWMPIPPDQPAPDDGTCMACFEWRRYPAGQEHFGFAWWRTCSTGCDHAHHDDEVWLAAVPA